MEAQSKCIEEKIVYFEQHGPVNTDTVLKLVAERAKARNINKIVVASTTGTTARAAAKLFQGSGIKLVIVPHQYNFMKEPQRFTPDLVAEMEKQGHKVHFGTMLFHTDDLYGIRTPSILAMAFRIFCQGMKVVVEIVLMATDAGCVDAGEKVIVVCGSGRGADTAVICTAAPSNRLYDMHITEIICKPLETRSWSLTGGPTPPPGAPKPGEERRPG